MRIRLREHTGYEIDEDGILTSATLVYVVDEIGAATVPEVLRSVQTEAPLEIERLQRGPVSLSTMPRGASQIVATVAYQPFELTKRDDPAKRHEGDEKWSFEATTGSFTATEALSQVFRQSVGTEELIMDVGKMIRWNGKYGADSSCAGVNVMTCEQRLRCRKTYLAATAQTYAFQSNIAAYVACVNSATFRSYAAGQVCFLGASVGETYWNDEDIELTDVNYSFAIKLNEPAKVIGLIEFPATEGWDYAWTTQQLCYGEYQPVLGVVSRVYKRKDLTGLGIGGSTSSSTTT